MSSSSNKRKSNKPASVDDIVVDDDAVEKESEAVVIDETPPVAIVARVTFGRVFALGDRKGLQVKVNTDDQGAAKTWVMIGRKEARLDANSNPTLAVGTATAVYLSPTEFGELLEQQEDIRVDMVKAVADEKTRRTSAEAQLKLAEKIIGEQGYKRRGGPSYRGGGGGASTSFKRFKHVF